MDKDTIEELNFGDIVKTSLNPTSGFEKQGDWRPVVVVSSSDFHRLSNLVIVVPISRTGRDFPLHIELSEDTKVDGSIEAEHLRTLDLNARGFEFIEHLPLEKKEELSNILEAIFEKALNFNK